MMPWEMRLQIQKAAYTNEQRGHVGFRSSQDAAPGWLCIAIQRTVQYITSISVKNNTAALI